MDQLTEVSGFMLLIEVYGEEEAGAAERERERDT